MSIIEASAISNKVGIVKPTRYLINFSGQPNLIPPAANIRLSVTCESANLPGKSVSTSEMKIYGRVRKVPYTPTYTNEITMTFRVGTDMYEKRVFDKWMDYIVDPNTYDFEYYQNYISTLEILQLGNSYERNNQEVKSFLERIGDKNENEIITNPELDNKPQAPNVKIGDEESIYICKIREVYPTSVQEISLSQSSVNEYSKVSVTFSFKDWVALPTIRDQDLQNNADWTIQKSETYLKDRQARGDNGNIILDPHR